MASHLERPYTLVTLSKVQSNSLTSFVLHGILAAFILCFLDKPPIIFHNFLVSCGLFTYPFTSGRAFLSERDYLATSWVVVSQGCRKLACKVERSGTSLKLNPTSRLTVNAIVPSSVQHMSPGLDKLSKDSV